MQTRNFIILLVLVATPFANFAHANPRALYSSASLSNQLCIEGEDADREEKSKIAIGKLIADQNYTADTPLDDVVLVDKSMSIRDQINTIADTLGCGFSNQSEFETVVHPTVGDATHAIANFLFHIKSKSKTPDWIKPGFVALLGSPDSDNLIYIKMTELGLVFRACEKNEVKDLPRPRPSDECDLLMNPVIFTSPDELIAETQGLKTTVITIAKAIGQATIVFTSNLGLGLISPIMQATTTFLDPNPIATIQRDNKVHRSISELLQLGNRAGNVGDNKLLTRVLPFPYDDLKAALIHTLTKIFNQDNAKLRKLNRKPKDPTLLASPALKIQRAFYQKMATELQAPVPEKKEVQEPDQSNNVDQ